MSTLPDQPPGSELYFAYGSNMYLPQMAVRCRESTLFARGILRKYRWQTNSLGGGNVVEAGEDDSVEGILFTLPPSDLEILRRYEGIEWGYFVEKEIDVEVEPVSETAQGGRSMKPADVAEYMTHHSSEFNLKLTAPKVAADASAPEQKGPSFSAVVEPTDTATESQSGPVIRKALVYLSYKYQVSGDIRDEYVVRMHLAMAYARLLGVSKHYLESSLYPQVFGKRMIAQKDG